MKVIFQIILCVVSDTVGLAFSSAHGYLVNEPFRFPIQMRLIHAKGMALQDE